MNSCPQDNELNLGSLMELDMVTLPPQPAPRLRRQPPVSRGKDFQPQLSMVLEKDFRESLELAVEEAQEALDDDHGDDHGYQMAAQLGQQLDHHEHQSGSAFVDSPLSPFTDSETLSGLSDETQRLGSDHDVSCGLRISKVLMTAFTKLVAAI